tara:strand:+ start:1682 stop:2818 length:1137 start_codon:yes stop_codon:yes gene_type:complete
MPIPKKTRKKTVRARARTGAAGAPMENWLGFSSYFHMEVDKKEFATITKAWVKKNYSKADAKAILANPEWNFTSHSHIAASIVWSDAGKNWDDLGPSYAGYATCAKKKMDPLIESGNQIIKEKKEADVAKSNVIILTPQQKLFRKVGKTIMTDLDDLEDQWIEGEKTTLDLYNQFKKHGLSGSAADMVRSRLEGWHLDYSDAYHKRCEQAVEGYSHLKRPEIKRRMKVIEEMLADLDKVKASAKATRKSRAPKVKTADKQVAKMQYLKEDKVFKLTSVDPTSIPGAIRLYTFNTKSKDFVELVSDSANGFEVSGSTLKKVDLEVSRKIKLRKPDEFLPKVLGGTVKQVDTAWKLLTTKTSTPNARINKDTILLKVSMK